MLQRQPVVPFTLCPPSLGRDWASAPGAVTGVDVTAAGRSRAERGEDERVKSCRERNESGDAVAQGRRLRRRRRRRRGRPRRVALSPAVLAERRTTSPPSPDAHATVRRRRNALAPMRRGEPSSERRSERRSSGLSGGVGGQRARWPRRRGREVCIVLRCVSYCVNRFYPKTQLSWLARLDHSHCADPLTDGVEVCCVFYRPGPGGAMCVVWWWKVIIFV